MPRTNELLSIAVRESLQAGYVPCIPCMANNTIVVEKLGELFLCKMIWASWTRGESTPIVTFPKSEADPDFFMCPYLMCIDKYDSVWIIPMKEVLHKERFRLGEPFLHYKIGAQINDGKQASLNNEDLERFRQKLQSDRYAREEMDLAGLDDVRSHDDL